jgi:outer membrane protein assembly factor BamD
MRKPAIVITLSLLSILSAPPSARALDIFGWKPFSGKKADNKEASQAQESAAQEQLRRGEALETEGRTDSALKVYRQIVKSDTLTAAAPKAQFHIGHILVQKGDYTGAFKAYSDYTTKYPRGTDFDAVIQAQFDIAKMYLGGKKTKILGVPVAPSYSRAEEMFADIVKRAPFHRLAPMAQFNVGQAYEKQDKNPEAIAAYREVITRYPGDPVATDAQYQLGYVQYRDAKTGSYNQATRQRAMESFEEFVNRQPQSEKTSQARENIKALNAAEVKNTLDIAKFYDKTKNYKAAVVYYNEVLRSAPGSPESEQARKRIEALKTTVGVDVLRIGPEKAESGEMALARRRAQARVDVASRPDFNGPYIPLPTIPADDDRLRPRSFAPLGPVTEPALPTGDPLQDPSAPPKMRANDPLIPLPAIPPVAEEPKPEPDPANKPK